MTTVRVVLGEQQIHLHTDDGSFAVPLGVIGLAESITSDPPRPEELVNVIGLVQDHLEDASREVPSIEFAQRVEIAGFGVPVVAAVELGGTPTFPFELSRQAAEEVFRTLATERRGNDNATRACPCPWCTPSWASPARSSP